MGIVLWKSKLSKFYVFVGSERCLVNDNHSDLKTIETSSELKKPKMQALSRWEEIVKCSGENEWAKTLLIMLFLLVYFQLYFNHRPYDYPRYSSTETFFFLTFQMVLDLCKFTNCITSSSLQFLRQRIHSYLECVMMKPLLGFCNYVYIFYLCSTKLVSNSLSPEQPITQILSTFLTLEVMVYSWLWFMLWFFLIYALIFLDLYMFFHLFYTYFSTCFTFAITVIHLFVFVK